jgi:DNA polymerase-3 subunit gamma/tau
MTYQVLYRTWRPQDFDELVGQDAIRRTLENALLQNRISHAYLFAGPRGTGKTSTARILAKALNCSNPRGYQPCGCCESCLSIQRGNSMDVLEIDAASNRGIEEIRDLKEKMGFMPALGKYKVYIVDEVHMLTTEAFNALLKTLEEPPAHVVFVLATTDVQKLPPTILSRCQRFDFRKIAPKIIQERLQEIVSRLEVPVEADVFPLIVKKADGGMRDAISLLDQCLAFSPEGLTAETAYQVLGMVRHEALRDLLQAIIGHDPQALFLQIDRLLQEGVEPMQLLRDLAEYCRNLWMLIVCGPKTELVMASEQERQTMLDQGQALGARRLQDMLTRLDQGAAGAKGRGNARFMAEALLAGLLTHPQAAETVRQAAKPAEGPMPGPAAARPVQAKAEALQTPAEKPADALKKGVAEPVKPVAKETSREENVPKEKPPVPAKPLAKGSAAGLASGVWEQILQAVKARRIVLHAFLTASVEQNFQDHVLTVNFDPEKGKFHKESAEKAENKQILLEAARQILDPELQINYGFKQEDLDRDPVKKALAIFGESIVEIKN